MRVCRIAWALALLAACDGGPGDGDAAVDADVPDPALVDIPWLAQGDPPLAPSPEHVCPDGFRREVTDHGVVSCLPWPEEGPADCTGPEAHFVGEAGCARIGTACPSGEWPEGLPTDRDIVYVRAGATGTPDGTMASPYADVGVAVSRAPVGAVVAVAKGTYDGRVDLFSDVTVWGACPEETVLTQSVPNDMDSVVGAFLGDGELTNLTVRAPVTIGVFIDGGVTARLRDVVVDQPHGYGVYVSGVGTTADLENVIVRGATSLSNGFGGTALQVIDGGAAVVRRASFEQSGQTGVVVAFDGTGTLERVAVRDNAGDGGDGRAGLGMTVQEGGAATVRASGFHRTPGGGILSALGSTLTMSDVALSEMTNGSGLTAAGVETRVGSSIDASFVHVSGAQRAALAGSEDGVLRATDLVVLDTHPGADGFALGATIEGQSRFTIERAHFEGHRRSGLAVDVEAHLEARDLVVRGTEGAGEPDIGVGLFLLGADVLVERAVIEDNSVGGIAISGETARTTLRDVVIRDTRSDIDGLYGRGVELNLGGHLTAERIVLERNREVGLYAQDVNTRALLSDLYVRDTFGQACGDGCPGGQQLGYGLAVANGGHLRAYGFVVTRSRLLNLQVGPAATVDAQVGELSESVIGVNVQEPTFELSEALVNVAFRDNERNVDAERLPVPRATLGE